MMVSVALCTYNGDAFIEEQLRSILNQSVCVDEIVICDDGSTDNTILLADRLLRTSSISYRILSNETNLGITKNFEKCISLCSGDIIFTSDQDDLWRSDKVEKLLELLDGKELALCFSDAVVIDGDGNQLASSLYKKDSFETEGFSVSRYADSIIRLGNTIYGCTMAFTKQMFEIARPFVVSDANHDAWLMCCAGVAGEILFTPEPLHFYRIHADNCVGSIGGSKTWDEIVKEQNAFEQYFAIHKLRQLRIELLKQALDRFPEKQGYFSEEARKAIRFYGRIQRIQNSRALKACFLLAVCLLDGCYHYRFCDRGRTIDSRLVLKQFFWDEWFLIRRKEMS